MKLLFTLCLISVLLLHVAAENLHEHNILTAPDVHTALGSLRGRYKSVKGTETGVHAYLGVPFAKPPVGPGLRLAAPQPVEGWEGVRDATQQPYMCVQPRQVSVDLMEKLGYKQGDIPEISEDCLYLNIYTPANRAQDTKLPVMVWIHGGGFSIGSASMYDGSALAAYQDVVVVLIQYRLGILGLLSTGDQQMSGNYGLLDQVLALRWIQQHIHNFGGNPDSVTIFGESAGGVCVSLLLLSSLSEGLVHRAIAQSGTAAMDILIINDPLPTAQMVANITGCSFENSEKIADCMRNVNVNAIADLGMDERLRLSVTVDGLFLKKPVDELFRSHELITVPFMTGVNNDEGGWMLSDYFAPANWTEGLDQDHVRNLLVFFFPNPEDGILRDLVVDEYTGTGEDRVKNREGFTEILGDMMFTIPAIKTANAHRGAPVYLYEYQHPPKYLQKLRPSFVRSDHGDEILTMFGLCFTNTYLMIGEPCDEEEEELSRTMMSYWGNFARRGCPNGDGLVHWPKYGGEGDFLSIDLKEQVTGQHLKKDRFVFLTQTLPEKIRQHQEKMDRSEL